MSDLSPEAQGILDQARDADDPSAGDCERVGRSLGDRLGIVALAPAVHATGAGAAAASGAAAGAFAKVVAVVVLVGLGAGVGAGAAWQHTRRAGHPAESAAHGASTARPPDGVPRSAPIPPTVWLPAVTPTPPVAAQAPDAHAAHAAAPQAAPGATLRAEVNLLSDAQTALRTGDPGRAMGLLDAYEARFPRGLLREEHAAARILALCQLGRTDEARAAATRFLRAAPASPLAERVAAGCGGQDPAPARPSISSETAAPPGTQRDDF